MPTDHRLKLATIKRFDQLITYLRDEMGWPIESGSAFEDLTFDYLPEELGIDPRTAAKIQEIKRLRPLSPRQPWGIFFVKFEPKKLPVVALRRILGRVALKQRASANSAELATWAADDLLFVSNYGEGDERQISFAHFSRAQDGHDLPTLKVLGWDNRDTALHLDAVARELSQHLAWPDDDGDEEAWRTRWRAAFSLGHREVVTTSKELAIRLAELARTIRDRINTALAIETAKGPLTKLMRGFQEALVHDLDADGFADMYAQTIAYGLLSARIADPHKKTADDFAAHMRTNPFLRELMETFLKVGGRRGKAGGPGIDFDELGVSEVVELLDGANMEAVVRDFGDRNPQEDPVIHFYELFLKEYDAKKRMQRGVFYTPRPVVSYIVRSVDELLRTEFSLADGLADTTTWGEMAKRHKDLKVPEGVSPEQDFVQILDPATGTGTFLVEGIDLIHRTLVAKWKAQGHGEKKIDALWNEYVPKHLLTRLHGYELLMAPYAIAHLKIGLKLYETGYRFGSEERARVYLTNALEPATELGQQFLAGFLSALAHEAQAVNEVKRKQRFTLVIGNPPYAGHSPNKGAWISELLKTRLKDGAEGYFTINGQKLGESNTKWLNDDYVKFIRLAQSLVASSGVGCLGYITSSSYLDNPTFRAMRASLLTTFSHSSILDLHGSAKKISAKPGDIDENVFDIQQGVAVMVSCCGLWQGESTGNPVKFAELKGGRASKFAVLQSSRPREEWRTISPKPPQYFFVPRDALLLQEFEAGRRITEVMPEYSIGCLTKRDDLVTGMTKEELAAKILSFIDSRKSTAAAAAEFGIRVSDNDMWDAHVARGSVKPEEVNAYIRRESFRPFDDRWIFYHKLFVARLNRRVMQHLDFKRSVALVCVRQLAAPPFFHAWVVNDLTDQHIISVRTKEGGVVFPLFLQPTSGQGMLLDGDRVNFSHEFSRHLAQCLEAQRRGSVSDNWPRQCLHFVYAQLFSLTYRTRYEEALCRDFPRVFIPRDATLFDKLEKLGGELVALHLLESPRLANPITKFLGGQNPEVEKVSWTRDTVWIDKAQTIGFRGVSEEVWNFHIGGYQVCEKWLKDRKGRTLSADDLAHYQKIVVALSETICLMKEIDEVIEQHGGWPGAFQTG
jgi:predicted helicase